MFGTEIGETCKRDGCVGVIDEYEKEGCCSCHINPPCGYCVEDNLYCPVCEWYSKDEPITPPVKAPNKDILFKRRTVDDLDNTKIDWISKSHTHFSMIKEGVYPEGVTSKEVLEKVKGTFGGRFNHFGNGKFKYTAYTD